MINDLHRSLRCPEVMGKYLCEVLYGGPGPLFRVTPLDAPDLRAAGFSLDEALVPIQASRRES